MNNTFQNNEYIYGIQQSSSIQHIHCISFVRKNHIEISYTELYIVVLLLHIFVVFYNK